MILYCFVVLLEYNNILGSGTDWKDVIQWLEAGLEQGAGEAGDRLGSSVSSQQKDGRK